LFKLHHIDIMKTVIQGKPARRGFTLTEILVAITIIAALVAVAIPSSQGVINNARQTSTLSQLRQFGTLAVGYATENNGLLPEEGGEGVQTFAALARPINAKAWYNVLPEMSGSITGIEFRNRPEDFYSAQSLFYLKGATYPKNRGGKAYFGFAINSQLQGGSGEQTRMHKFLHPSRTVLFAEARLPDERRLPPFGNGVAGDDLGQPKVRDKRFVARYNNKGIIIFADGSAGAVDAKVVFNPRNVIWDVPKP
jgi:prepilin-type N-terminal cleavage/methylation domain-containing protein